MTTTSNYRRDGVNYNLTADEVASEFGKSIDWVRTHAEALGGKKDNWKDGYKRPATFRFPSKGIKSRVVAVEQAMAENRRSRAKRA